jgi:hypothetical protein
MTDNADEQIPCWVHRIDADCAQLCVLSVPVFVIQRYMLSIKKILFLTIVTDLSNIPRCGAAIVSLLNMGIVSVSPRADLRNINS